MKLHDDYLKKQIAFLEAQNALMRLLCSRRGFYEFYLDNFTKYGDKNWSFRMTNQIYKMLLGRDRYASFQEFEDDCKTITTVNSKDRDYLVNWFINRGFDSWDSFKPIVMHHYPDVCLSSLYAFWKDKEIDPYVLLRVEHTRQILG